MGLMGPMRLMGMRKEATRAGMSTERLKSGAAKSLEKTAPLRAEIFAPSESRSVAGWDWLWGGAVQEFGNEWCGWESVDFRWGTDLLDVSVIHHYDAIS
jgi:hypothetical protein